MKIMLRKAIKVFSIFALVFFTGCATQAKTVSSPYFPPLKNHGSYCDQMSQEKMRIGEMVQEISSRQDRAANEDADAINVGCDAKELKSFIQSLD